MKARLGYKRKMSEETHFTKNVKHLEELHLRAKISISWGDKRQAKIRLVE